MFERAMFDVRRQEPGENYVHKLAEHCKFGPLRDKMIRDQIVVGIRDVSLSEKLQQDDKLTLSKAFSRVRQSKTVKQQQAMLYSGESPQFEPNEEIHVFALTHVKKGWSAEQTKTRTEHDDIGYVP